MQELVRYEQPATAVEIRQNVNLIQEVMKAVMKDGTHYGTIPGTPKPTLYKPGAEKIFMTFRIAGKPEVEDLSTSDEIRYRVTFNASSQAASLFLGAGNGECSSDEEKYKWRKPVCDEEWEEAAEDERREVWKKSGGKAAKIKQVRIRPADIANTILKMATKRAMVAACLLVTAASDVFDQDIEDLPDGYEVNGHPVKTPPAKPKRKSAGDKGALVEDVRIKKEGTSAKGPYKIWTITVGGVGYDTFSETDAEAAIAAQEAGQPVAVKFNATQYGKNLTEITVVEAEPEEQPKAAPGGLTGDMKLAVISSLTDENFAATIVKLEIEGVESPMDLSDEQIDVVFAEVVAKK